MPMQHKYVIAHNFQNAQEKSQDVTSKSRINMPPLVFIVGRNS